MYSGKVINKLNGQPIEGISVSDGRNVTRTDKNGFYTLDGWEHAHLINVGILTEYTDDWYIYIDGHEGDFDFYVTPAKTDAKNFSFLHISDTEELSDNDRTDWVDFVKNTVKEQSASFFVHTGDIAREYGLRKHKTMVTRDTIGCPVRYTIGNHDFTDADYGEQLYEKLHGPTWYSFDFGDIHFLALSVAGFTSTDFKSCYTPDDQWAWVENDLANSDPSKKVFVLCHSECHRDPLGFCLKGSEKDYDLKDKNLLAWAYGHTHVNYLHDINGILYINSSRPDSGGVDSSEGAIRKITLDGHELSSEMIYCSPYKLEKDEFIWEQKLCGRVNFCTPVYIDGDVIVGTVDDGYPKQCGIYRVDGTSGNILWSFPTKNSITGSLAYDSGKIYAQDNFATVYCIDAKTGNETWKKDNRISRTSYTRNGALIADDLLITGNPANIRALDKNTGDTVWEYIYKRGEDTPVKLLYDKDNHQIILSSHWYALMALDYDTGEVKWANTDPYLWFRTSTPLLHDNKMHIASRGKYFEVDAASGKIIKCKDSKGVNFEVPASPVLCDNILYISTANVGVVAVDKDTFEEIHRFPCENANLFTPPYLGGKVQTVNGTPIIDNKNLIFAASDGTVRFYNRHTKELLKTINVGSPVLQTPIITFDGIITVDFDGIITKFKLD